MPILKYPANGLTPLINNDIFNAYNSLNSADSKSNLSTPSDFPQAGYINNLNTLISEYKTICNNISNAINNTDKNIDLLVDELNIKLEQIEQIKITKKDRLIS